MQAVHGWNPKGMHSNSAMHARAQVSRLRSRLMLSLSYVSIGSCLLSPQPLPDSHACRSANPLLQVPEHFWWQGGSSGGKALGLGPGPSRGHQEGRTSPDLGLPDQGVPQYGGWCDFGVGQRLRSAKSLVAAAATCSHVHGV